MARGNPPHDGHADFTRVRDRLNASVQRLRETNDRFGNYLAGQMGGTPPQKADYNHGTARGIDGLGNGLTQGGLSSAPTKKGK